MLLLMSTQHFLPSRIFIIAAACLGWSGGTLFAQPVITPIEVIQEPPIDYPEAADTTEYPTGSAQVMIYVDADGKLVDAVLLGFSKASFGKAAMRAVQAWSYEPATIDGRAVSARKFLEFGFSAEGSVVGRSVSGHLSERLNTFIGLDETDLVARPAQLDTPVEAVETVPPAPVELDETVEVRLEFIIDEDGRPRMPIAVAGSNPLAVASAVEALLQWRFEAPRRNGKPTMVRASQTFLFGPPANNG